ncbi:MAG: hypothetical protein HUJ56_01495 [Erysipelotrichaceae bacterium]|nr:hypothetical protein [Erysipelotrichaceae bacterium]
MTQIIMGENCNSELSDVSIITEDALLDPSLANAKLANIVMINIMEVVIKV